MKRNHKEFNLIPQKDVLSTKSFNKVASSAKDVAKNTDKKIEAGLKKPNASTGTPIKDLNGGAKFMAQLSNIGGGSKSTGGGGIKDGLNAITQNTAAKSTLKTLQLNHKNTKGIDISKSKTNAQKETKK